MEALQILVKNMEKKDIRKQVFAQRAKTSEAFVQQQSSLIAGKIFALPQFQDASCIYVYMDYNKEASTRPIIEEAWRLGKKVAAPKVFGEDMRYFYIHSYQKSKISHYLCSNHKKTHHETFISIISFDPCDTFCTGRQKIFSRCCACCR